MKRKTICNNGNIVERFYDRQSRSSVTMVTNSAGDQIGDAEYDGNKESAKCSYDYHVKANGGEKTKQIKNI